MTTLHKWPWRRIAVYFLLLSLILFLSAAIFLFAYFTGNNLIQAG